MVNAVSPTHTTAFTPTMRITVDGTVYTIAPTAAQTLAFRMLLGPVTPGFLTSAGGAVIPNAEQDNGFANAAIGGLNQVVAATSTVALVTPEMALSMGSGVLRFETSLLVEMKCDLLSANAIDKQCGVTYVLDL